MYFLFLVAFLAPALASPVDEYIVGGWDVAEEGTWPWQASLRTSSGSHTCGCVVTHANYLLTAAHCITSCAGYSVEAGMLDRNTGTVWSLTSCQQHPNYGSGSGAYPNDVGILYMSGSVTGPNIANIEVETGIDRTTQACWITGWGRLYGNGPLPIELQEVNIPVISDADCTRMWGGNYNPTAHVCVWDEVNLDKGACNGDSGGPLVCRASSGDDYELIGLASWVYSGCNTAWPTAYARVSSYRDWFCTQTGSVGC